MVNAELRADVLVSRLRSPLNPNSEVARPCGKKPLTRLATLATLSPRERAEFHHRRPPSPLGRGWPAAGEVISRCGTGEGLLPGNPKTRSVLEIIQASNSVSTSRHGSARFNFGIRTEYVSPRSGCRRVAHGVRICEKIDACHPERCEGSRQFLVLQRFTYNCRDPSLHSG